MSMHDSVSIIGARGFVGAHLVRHYEAQGIEVRAYGRGDEARLLSHTHGTVFYCAGFTGDFAADPVATVEAHAGLIGRVIARATFSRLVYCSSTRLYDSAGVPLADEETPLNLSPNTPRHLYDLSKALGENLCLNDPKKRCIVARISNIFSLDDQATGFLIDWMRAALQSPVVALNSSPHFGRDYIHIDDAIAALLALASTHESAIINVASGRLTTNAEIADHISSSGFETRFLSDTLQTSIPCIATERLRQLGVTPRDPRDIILKTLTA